MQGTDPREADTFRANIQAQDDAVLELMTRYNVPARDAVRIIHSVAQAAWHRGHYIASTPMTPIKENRS